MGSQLIPALTVSRSDTRQESWMKPTGVRMETFPVKCTVLVVETDVRNTSSTIPSASRRCKKGPSIQVTL